MKNKKNIVFKTLEKSILVGLALTVIFSLVGFTMDCEKISTEVFRVHVIANSDSNEDQQLKLKVKDKINEYAKTILPGVNSRKDAEKIISEHLNKIEKIAEDEINNNGYTYPVKVEMKNMYFNTRVYENVTLPAGMYDALRVTIGEGKGKNWWCVMFPPMCVAAASETEELSSVLDENEMDIVQNGENYEIKFKSVELFENIKNTIKGN